MDTNSPQKAPFSRTVKDADAGSARTLQIGPEKKECAQGHDWTYSGGVKDALRQCDELTRAVEKQMRKK